MKKLLLLSSLAMATLGVNAATLIDGLYYELSGNSATVVATQSPDVTYTGDIVIPSTVTSDGNTYTITAIGRGAFEYSTVTSVTFPDDQLITVNAYAFDTETIKYLKLGNQTDLQGNAVSVYCSGLTDIYCTASTTIPAITGAAVASSIRPQITLHLPATNEPTVLARKYTTAGWTGFRLIIYANQVEQDGLFYSLNTTDKTATLLSVYDTLQVANGQTTDYHAFYLNGPVTVPTTVTSQEGEEYAVKTIGYGALWINNGDFTSITLSEGITTIGVETFYGLSKLTELYLPSTLTSMSTNDLTYSPNVEKITCMAVTPPAITSTSFCADNYTKATLYVPEQAVEAYKAADYWKNFTNIEAVKIAAENVELSDENITLTKIGDSYKLAYTITPAGASDDITWSTSDPDVATVDNDGTVTAVGDGTCTITLTVGDLKAECLVTVDTKVPAESVTLSDTDLTITEKDGTHTLTYTVTPADTTDPVSWSSSNEAVATVDNGVVTAVANGTCIITLTVGDLKAECQVNVAIQSGVADINIDNNADVRYFNLQGIEIANPAKGQMVIIRQGNKSVKAVVR